MKAIFMGTPEFAVPILHALYKNHEVALVITQPDRPKGRGKKLCCPPVKEYALTHNIPLLQPERIKGDAFFSQIQEIAPDVIIVAAYGSILPERILKLPRFGCINVHASLLPKYRGAAPIHWAVMKGESITGVTIIFMDKGIDTGDMILKKEQPIGSRDTAGLLLEKLSLLGAEALIEALELVESGNAPREKQDDSMSCYAPMLDSETGKIDWNADCETVINKVRGLSPEPGAYFYYHGQKIKLFEAELTNKDTEIGYDEAVGTITGIVKNRGFTIGCADGCILATRVQAPGGKIMGAADFLRGHELQIGEILN